MPGMGMMGMMGMKKPDNTELENKPIMGMKKPETDNEDKKSSQMNMKEVTLNIK